MSLAPASASSRDPEIQSDCSMSIGGLRIEHVNVIPCAVFASRQRPAGARIAQTAPDRFTSSRLWRAGTDS
jgi:hypothetical protein